MRRYAMDALVVVCTLIVCLALWTAYQDHQRINAMWQWIVTQDAARQQASMPSLPNPPPQPEPTKKP